MYLCFYCYKKAENDALNDKVKGVSSRKTILEKDMKEVRHDFERSKSVRS